MDLFSKYIGEAHFPSILNTYMDLSDQAMHFDTCILTDPWEEVKENFSFPFLEMLYSAKESFKQWKKKLHFCI